MFSSWRNLTAKSTRTLLKIKDIRHEQNEFVTYVLEKPENWQVFPGQYIALFPTALPRELQKPLRLALTSGTTDEDIEITLNTTGVHTLSIKNILLQYRVGQSIVVDGPFGHGFSLNDEKSPLLLVGAGSGISLLRSILHSVTKDRDIQIIYSAKTLEDIPYAEVKEWVKDPKYYVSLTREENLLPGFHEGRINDYLITKNITPQTKVLITGPDTFIQSMAGILIEKGHAKNNIYISLNQPGTNQEQICSLESLSQNMTIVSPEKKKKH